MSATQDVDSTMLLSGYPPPASMTDWTSSTAFDVEEKPRSKHVYYPLTTQLAEDDDTVTLTGLTVRLSDPFRAIADEIRDRTRQTRVDLQSYRVRIATLQADAALDGYALSPASEHDFWCFIRSEPFLRKGNLVLLDNGNLRAVWKDRNGSHIGLQFLGGGVVQYVIFKRRPGVEAISRVSGRDSIRGVKRQIQAFDLRKLMYA